MPKIILASTSKYRKALVERLGLSVDCIAPGVDEEAFKADFIDPVDLATRLAVAKARAVAKNWPDAIVIGADQLATMDGRVLGKPGTFENAVAQLESLSGRTHTLVTAMSIMGPGDQMQSHLDLSHLTMRQLTCAELEKYVARDKPLDCAGSYKLEEAGIALFDQIQTADHTAITGLPLVALVSILRSLGVALPC